MADREFPEIYADGVQVGAGPYGVSLTLYLSNPAGAPQSPGDIVGRVRFSRELAGALKETIEIAMKNAPAGSIERMEEEP
jgi:hypothetical protein